MNADSPATSAPRDPKLHPADWVLQAGAVDDVLGGLDALLQRRRQRRKVVGATAGAIACLALGLWLVPFLRDTQSVSNQPARRQTLALADGSRAELNARTDVRADFRYGRRTVRLERGEAFFSVARDAAHPFLVETPAGTIRVTGTQFNVRLTPDGRAEVTLLEGTVSVTSARATLSSQLTTPQLLSPGQQLSFGATTELHALSARQMERVVAWRQGRAIFDGDSLAAAVARFADYHGVAITVAPEVRALRLGGSYPLDELKPFLDALQATQPVRVLKAADGSYRITAR